MVVFLYVSENNFFNRIKLFILVGTELLLHKATPPFRVAVEIF